MSNYTLAVSWSEKDALADSDTNKVISGADFNTEFTTIQTAVNSKANINGSANESFSATTATESTNTTQVATTAFVETATSKANIADVVYPIGAIFTTVTAYANSAAVVTAIGGTEWETFGAGKVLVGVDPTDTVDEDFDTVEKTGGSKTHTLTTAEMPSHTHTVPLSKASWAEDADNGGSNTYLQTSGVAHTPTTSSSGSGDAHNNIQPYITVYMWKRTA